MTKDDEPRCVWKYVVPQPNEECRSVIECPTWTEFISVGTEVVGKDGVPVLDSEQIVVWALVDPRPETERVWHRLIVANTGVEIPNHPNGDIRFLGTVRTSNGIVWHVWDEDQASSVPPK